MGNIKKDTFNTPDIVLNELWSGFHCRSTAIWHPNPVLKIVIKFVAATLSDLLSALNSTHTETDPVGVNLAPA